MANQINKGKVVTPAPKSNIEHSSARSGVGSGAGIYVGRFVQELLRDPDELIAPDRRHATYRVMAQTDPYIAETLRTHSLPLIAQATWEVRAPEKTDKTNPADRPDPPAKVKAAAGESGATTSEEKPDERNEDIARLVACNLLGQESDDYGSEFHMQSTWSQFLREACMMLNHGYSVFHKEYKAVEGKQVFSRLLWLEPQTIWRWEIDESDNFLGITRRYRRADGSYVVNEFLPKDDLILFVWDITGTRLEGIPLLRSQFGAWKRKEFIERCKMIALQQSGVGIPIATWDPEKWGSLDNIKQLEDRIEDALQSSLGAGLGTAYLAVPNDTFKADYLRQSGSDLEAFDKLSSRESITESHGGGTKSQTGGETALGTKNAASVQRSLEYVVTLAVATVLAEQMVRGVAGCKGPVQDLCDTNFSAVKRYPQVVCTGVDPDEATRNLPLVKDLMSAGAIKYRLKAEQQLWRRLGVNLPDGEFDPDNPVNQEPDPSPIDPMTGLPVKLPPSGQKGPPPTGPKGGRPRVALPAAENRVVKRGNKLSLEDARRETLRLNIEQLLRSPASSDQAAQEAGYMRAPTEFEARVCLLGQISASLNSSGAKLGGQLLAMRAVMIEDICARMKAGKIAKDNFHGLRRSNPKGVTPYRRELEGHWRDTAVLGRAHAEGELLRQKEVEYPPYMMATDDDGPNWNQLPPGAPIPTNAQVPHWVIQEAVEAFQQEALREGIVGVQISVDELWARLVDEAINIYMRLSRQHVPEAEIAAQVEAGLQALSLKPELQVGREMAHVAYNQGRDVAAKVAAQKGEAKYGLRSEVLDTMTCVPCRGLDGTLVLIGTPEYEQLLPPSRCLGDDGCRGIMVLLSEALVNRGANNG